MPTHAALEKFVARLLRRSPLTCEEQQALLQLPFRASHISARTDIVSPGERTTHACLVAKGMVARFDQMRDGKRQITAFHIPGDMCDLHSTVAPIAAWGMTALPATTVLFVPHADLGALAVSYPQIGIAFWRDGIADSTLLAKWLVNLGRQDARARLAHFFCEMGVRIEAAGLGSRVAFTLEVTQEQLADALGLTAVHVNRTMQSLRREGLIATRSHVIEVLDWAGLAAAGDFDRAYLLLDEPCQREFERAAQSGRPQILSPLN